ncbi:ABC transporter permease [Rathayibacter sp. VKM Ac-2803]|uniref:ABC transporter permease n=1 Tax=Rathayibacter sp. VKM Ac-2803 TaxID=2609256 RepID=UPI00135C6C21|nr:ABC transporter permease [Rathayibacter sp. VKM Ac-2803]MWV49314.1 ABC transporter permease [Rathayibacter sp. VKM Ac-2803]
MTAVDARPLPFLRGVRIVLGLELAQRVRGASSFVLLGLFFVLVGAVTALLIVATGVLSGSGASVGGWIYSILMYFVLLLGSLVTPALSGTAVNGDRDAGTLATTQVTLVTTAQLVIGKFVSAWLVALAFLASTVPFLLIAVLVGGVAPASAVVSVLVLSVQLGVVAAIGVGLSGILDRPLMSVVTTYLLVAALSVGSLIAFGLLTAVTQTTQRTVFIGSTPGSENYCGQSYETPVARADLYWGLLAVNPFVVLADAVPPELGAYGQPEDLFGSISLLVRQAQIAPEEVVEIECRDYSSSAARTPEEVFDETVPSWFVGLALQLVLGVGLILGAIRRTATPAARLPRGRRVA